MANALTDPPFADDPPLKLSVDSKVLGLVIGILSVVAGLAWLLVSVTGLWVVGSVNPYCSAFDPTAATCGTTNGIFILGVAGFVLVVAGSMLSAIGGFRMFAMVQEAKSQAIYGLVLGAVGGVIATIGYTGFLSVFIFDLLLGVVVYYLIIVSRFPDPTTAVASDDDDW